MPAIPGSTTTATAKGTSSIAPRQESFGQMFLDRVAATPDREAFRFPVGTSWESLTWKQARDRVFAISAGLISIGISPEERVAIAANTRVEWVLADLGILCAGAACTTVYPSTSQEDVAYILSDSQSRVVIAENAEQVAKILGSRSELPDLIKIVVLDPAGVPTDDLVMTFAALEEQGKAYLKEHPEAVSSAIAAVGPESLATLIYTSGTTGKPKGVRLVHDNWTYEGWAVELMDILTVDDVQYLWLPLSHVFGKVLTAVQLRIGFATAIDGNLDRIVENLAVVKPTFMAGAPRIFEKVRAKVKMTGEGGGGLKPKIFRWAFAVADQVTPLKLAGKKPTGLLAVKHSIADKLVFSTIRGRLGGRIRFFVSGSAALSREVAEWFYATGMTVVEGYGLSETSAATFVGLPDAPIFGTVGPVLTGTEVKIAEDGEILVKGPGVMRGYHNMPEATAEVFVDGWFATGDIGEIVQGRLKVTDRKKDLIKTSGGKYVAPQKIEIAFKAISPYASQIVVHGDGRKFISALITLDPEPLEEWAKANGLGSTSYTDLTSNPKVKELISGQIEELNRQLERWETIKKFEILPQDLSVENGEITPSMKVRRKAVEKQNMDVLNSFYTD
ncbi:long-chain fatty acid--CoA ligase [Nakamurella silvestris]|nr:long-chain fatty acid--CoA ligase [Nakamurella silvestris]